MGHREKPGQLAAHIRWEVCGFHGVIKLGLGNVAQGGGQMALLGLDHQLFDGFTQSCHAFLVCLELVEVFGQVHGSLRAVPEVPCTQTQDSHGDGDGIFGRDRKAFSIDRGGVVDQGLKISAQAVEAQFLGSLDRFGVVQRGKG